MTLSQGAQRLRIVLVLGSLDIGGTETQVARLACELRARGHDVTLAVLTDTGPLGPRLEACGVPIVSFGVAGFRRRKADGRLDITSTLRSLAGVAYLYRWLRRSRPDVVHAFLFWAYVIVLPMAWLARVPLRISGRRNLGTEKLAYRLYPLLETVADRCSHYAVANSLAVARVVEKGSLTSDRIVVIPNGVDAPRSPAEVRVQPPRIVMVANLIAYKGHADLIQAAAELAVPVTIDCYGEGPERAALERLIAQRGLQRMVRLHGTVEGASREFLRAQLAVLPSHEEGLPNAVLEAMAAGVATVATRVGGVPELIEHERTGLLVSPHAPRELASAIDRLARDPQLRERLGTAARRHVEQQFSWDECVRAHEELYRGRE